MHVEIVLLVLSLLFFASIFTDKIGYRFGVPALLLFLGVGMLFGPEGIGLTTATAGLPSSIGKIQAVGTVCLCIILFSGGLDTKITDILPVVYPGITLASLGVFLTTIITGVVIWFIFGHVGALYSISLPVALLIAATMSSTDSASVFSILRTNRLGLKHNLRPLLELESGSNDPMAYILTITLIAIVKNQGGEISYLGIIQNIFIQLVMGGVMGYGFGKVIVFLLRRVHLFNESLYPIMVLTACIFIFSATYFLNGNPYLAVYIGGVVIGNHKFTRRRPTKSFFDGLTWLSQLVMFLMLGMMVSPSELLEWDVLVPCLVISFVMLLLSRPISVFLCMIPFKQYKMRDKIFLSWVGLKGAVPIFFAILCIAESTPQSNLLFNVVFLCTIVSLIFQGTTLSSMAKLLHLDMIQKEKKRLVYFDIDLPDEIQSSASERIIDSTMLQGGNLLKNLSLPEHTLVIMVRRGEDFFVPMGNSVLQEGDQILVITDYDAMETVRQKEDDEKEERLWKESLKRPLIKIRKGVRNSVSSVFHTK